MIKEIIRSVKAATGLKMKPFGTNKVEECICYKYYPALDNGCLSQSRLELRIITFTVERAETIKKQVNGALLNVGDTGKIPGVTDISLNGGGTMEDLETGTIHTQMNYILKMRSDL